MINDLIAYEEYLMEQYQMSLLNGNTRAEKYYFDKAFDCSELIYLFGEMKLSTNEWYTIKTLVKEYRALQYGN